MARFLQKLQVNATLLEDELGPGDSSLSCLTFTPLLEGLVHANLRLPNWPHRKHFIKSAFRKVAAGVDTLLALLFQRLKLGFDWRRDK
jgi:hypothetical protein